MHFRVSRLTAAERLLAAASLLLLLDLLVTGWFGHEPSGRAVAGDASTHLWIESGWRAFNVLGPLTAVVCLVGLAATLLTAVRRSPALPVVITTLMLPVGCILLILMAIRVLIVHPGVRFAGSSTVTSLQPRAGAYAGIVLCAGVCAAGYLSLRRDGGGGEDTPASVASLRAPSNAG